MIYTDGVYLITDSENLEELHKFAHSVGLKRKWFQQPKKWQPHYSVWGGVKRRVMLLVDTQPGKIKLVDSFDIVDILKKRIGDY